MSVLKCKMCGGSLVIEAGSSVCECEYCGSKQTIPRLGDEKKSKLFERANRLRLNCEFDKAAVIYERLIDEFVEEAEAYWGHLLCMYGIEYVTDPKTGKRIPTCHRSSYESVMDSEDFECVMENADLAARTVYREQAKQIEELRKKIVEVSGKEQPYDVFICYKETDENGQRTIDSVLAQDVFEALTQRGYRVFFSRISLEDKLGSEYEPIIFAALNSAKIMLAFGTSYDNYAAVWVKNEWSRFLKLMSSDKNKYLIPCYKDIDAYDIPKEFRALQAQDFGKVGAIQDLLRGIDKLMGKQSSSEIVPPVTTQVVMPGGINLDALIERGYMALEDGDFKSAESFFNRVLDVNSKEAEVYLGLLMVQMGVKTKEEAIIRYAWEDYSKDPRWTRAKKYAVGKLAAELIHWEDERKKQLREIEAIQTLLATGQYELTSEEQKEEEQLKEETAKAADECRIKEESILTSELMQAYNHLNTEIPRKEAEFLKLGFFKKKEKRELYNQIKELKKLLEETEGRLAKDRGELSDLRIIADRAEKKASTYRQQLHVEKLKKYKEMFGDLIFFERGSSVFFGWVGAGRLMEWIVLERTDNEILLLCKYGYSTQKYNKDYSQISWETCSLREWLNNTFINRVFNEKERLVIEKPILKRIEKNKYYGFYLQQHDTVDQVFLLNTEEVEKYLPSEKMRQCVALDTSNSGEIQCQWWLRTPGAMSTLVECVSADGKINHIGQLVNSDDIYVRPAIIVNLDSIKKAQRS